MGFDEIGHSHDDLAFGYTLKTTKRAILRYHRRICTLNVSEILSIYRKLTYKGVKMKTLDNVSVARTFHEAWAERNPDRGAAVIADDCKFVDVSRGEIQHGPEGYRHDYERWRTAFPDGTVEITNVIAEGDWVVIEFTNSGTNTGPLRTAIGDFPPTNRKIKVQYCSVMQIRNGKVISGRDYYDVSTILRQLGHAI